MSYTEFTDELLEIKKHPIRELKKGDLVIINLRDPQIRTSYGIGIITRKAFKQDAWWVWWIGLNKERKVSTKWLRNLNK